MSSCEIEKALGILKCVYTQHFRESTIAAANIIFLLRKIIIIRVKSSVEALNLKKKGK